MKFNLNLNIQSKIIEKIPTLIVGTALALKYLEKKNEYFKKNTKLNNEKNEPEFY